MDSDEPSTRIALSISSRPGRPADEQPTYRGAIIAMDELHADDEFPVELGLEVFDDEGDTDRTVAYANEIVEDDSFVGVVGPMGSSEALANAPIFSDAGIAQISPCASHPDLARYETFYRLVANEDVQGHELSRISQEYLDADDVAVVYTDDDWGNSVAEIYTREFETLGGTVAMSAAYAVGEESNVAELAERVLEADPDLVFLVVHANEGREISSGLRDHGVDVPFLGTDAMKPQFPLGGGEEGRDVYHTHAGADFQRLPSATAFRDEYVDRYPPDSTYSPEAYDAVMILAEAIRRAETPTRENVLAEVEKMDDFEGVSGAVVFDDGERANAYIGLYKVRLTDDGRELDYLGTTNEII
jgi:branched-chain amino acid transport system substrate-binding protein